MGRKMSNLYIEAIHAIEHPQELVDGPAFRRMLLAILSAPQDFSTDADAEDFVRVNEYGCARVIERNVHTMTYWGAKHK